MGSSESISSLATGLGLIGTFPETGPSVPVYHGLQKAGITMTLSG